MMPNVQISAFKVLRLLRVLRPLRMISKNQGLKVNSFNKCILGINTSIIYGSSNYNLSIDGFIAFLCYICYLWSKFYERIALEL